MKTHRDLIACAKACAATLLLASPVAAKHLIVRSDYVVDGGPSDRVGCIVTDPDGFVWVCSPAVRIGVVQAAGEPLPLSPLGVTCMPALQLTADQRQLQFEYFGLGFGADELQFQVRLDRVDNEWGTPTSQPSVRYAGLGPTHHPFQVQAVSVTGRVSAQPATLHFTIAPLLRRRASFLAGLAVLLAAMLVYAHKLRVRRLLELERIRTRIAADLHDDLGASLARVSLLSEATRRALREARPDRAEHMLDEIGTTSRELVTAAGDIAFSIDPGRSRLDALVARLRRFAEDLVAGSGIGWRFSVDGEAADVVLSSEQRRHLLAILKEALHNAVRHAQSGHVSLILRRRDGALEIDVVDDGRGFRIDASGNGGKPEAGHGLRNLRDRARELGAQLEIKSQPGAGTRISLRCPLPSRPRIIMRYHKICT